jgi:hypothetical protein
VERSTKDLDNVEFLADLERRHPYDPASMQQWVTVPGPDVRRLMWMLYELDEPQLDREVLVAWIHDRIAKIRKRYAEAVAARLRS